jgi:Secretion system C-terminal sorting domain
MKQFLPIIFIFIFSMNLQAQRDTINYLLLSKQKELMNYTENVNVSIYPVPVRDNILTIRSDKEISAIRITNIIGQDIFRVKYGTPQLLTKIVLDNPRHGMYLVIILFSDDTRVVKKVMIEGYN